MAKRNAARKRKTITPAPAVAPARPSAKLTLVAGTALAKDRPGALTPAEIGRMRGPTVHEIPVHVLEGFRPA